MATKKKKRAAAKKNPKKKRARARAANPKKKRARARATNPKKKRARARATNPKKKRARARNPKKKARRRNARRRRSNPGWANLGVIFGGLAVGVVAGIGSAWINAGPLGNRRMAAQNGVLLAEGAAAAYFIDNPVFAVSAVIGIFIVPIASFIYKAAPALAQPTPWGQPSVVVVGGTGANGPGPGMAPAAPPGAALPPPSAATAAAAPSTPAGQMAALHQANVRRLRALDTSMDSASMGALHRGVSALHRGGVRALHRKGNGVGALHQPQMRALHMGGVGFHPVHVSRLPHQSSSRTSRT